MCDRLVNRLVFGFSNAELEIKPSMEALAEIDKIEIIFYWYL